MIHDMHHGLAVQMLPVAVGVKRQRKLGQIKLNRPPGGEFLQLNFRFRMYCVKFGVAFTQELYKVEHCQSCTLR